MCHSNCVGLSQSLLKIDNNHIHNGEYQPAKRDITTCKLYKKRTAIRQLFVTSVL